MIKYINILFSAVCAFFVFACGGDDFQTSFDGLADAGQETDASGGSSGSPSTGGSGAVEQLADSGKVGSTDDAGFEPDSAVDPPDAGQDSGLPDPCTVDLTAPAAASLLNEDCVSLFGQLSCDTGSTLTRARFIHGLMQGAAVPSTQRQGFIVPTEASYADSEYGVDYFAFEEVELARWLGVIDIVDPFFYPEGIAKVCWAADIIAKIEALPETYAVYSRFFGPSNVGKGVVFVNSVQYTVYGTSTTNRLTGPFRIVNNLQANFGTPQDNPAVDRVRFVCNPVGGVTEVPMVNGVAEVTPDCADEGGGLVVTISVITTPDATSGSQYRIALDPNTPPGFVRGGGHSSVNLFTVN